MEHPVAMTLGNAVSRRGILAGGLAVAACHPREIATTPVSGHRAPAADAHAHFFNLADLPVAGFVTYVIVGAIFPPPPWAEAMIDFIAGFAKRFAKSAQREAATLGQTETLNASRFGKRAADFVNARLATIPTATGDGARLTQSYEALLDTLARETDVPAPARDMAVPGAAIDAKRVAFTRAARIDEFDETALIAGGFNPLSAVGVVARTIGWTYLMTRSRNAHIERYLDRQRSDDREMHTMVALLVDYDYWLDDTPALGSAMPDQIRTMGLLRKRFAPRADLRIFAGICPLRLAIARRTGKPALFDRIKAEVAAQRVHGFKLYPPMGFRAAGNALLSNSDFDPPPARRNTAWDRWRSETGDVAPKSLGRALDAALAEVYAYAAANGVAIVAHAGPGNGAAKGFGDRASPVFWEDVVAKHPIRLNLGHLVNDAKPFIAAVLDGGSRAGIWALDAPLRMLDRRRPSAPDIYGDLAHMPELNDPDCCRAFFQALLKAFGPGDPKLERILYGTDWIMYAREARSDRYLATVEAGMHAAGYSGEQIDNILWNNTRRFLG